MSAGPWRSAWCDAPPPPELQFGCEVAELRKDGDGWALLAQNGEALATARTVVLANAGAASRLADAAWPMEPLRGQMSVFAGAAAHGLHGPRLPITGSGYVLPVIDGNLVFGATRSRDDVDPAVRLADHRLNLAQLAALSSDLTGSRAMDPATLSGRTAWRWSSRDRLPIIGAVPARLSVDEGRGMGAGRRDQPRFVAREPGLFVFTALGSRGITWSALGAQLLASIVSGAPSPIEAALLDAVDPARFGVRDGRRAGPPQRPPAQMP